MGSGVEILTAKETKAEEMKTMGGGNQAKEGKGLDDIPWRHQKSGELAVDPATECFWNEEAHIGTRLGAC